MKKLLFCGLVFIIAIGLIGYKVTFKSADQLTSQTLSQNETLPLLNSIRCDGDSFGTAIGAIDPENIFIKRVAKDKGLVLTNAHVAGRKTIDVWNDIKANVPIPSPYKYHMLNVGFNDVRQYGATNYFEKEIAHRLKAIIAFLRSKTLYDDNNTHITYHGTWETNKVSESYGGSNHSTATPNSYAEFVFTGDKIAVGTFVLNAVGSDMTIAVDGVVKKIFTNGNQAGNPYGVTAIELTGLGSGNHTLRITKTDTGTDPLLIDWIGIPSDNPPVVIVNGLTIMKAASYSLYPPYNNGSDASIALANKTIKEYLVEFDKKVIFVDQSDYDLNNYNLTLSSDNVHPNDFGHEWLARNILKKI